MDVLASFLIFLAAMAVCLVFKINIIAALIAGWAVFMTDAMRRGCSFKSLMRVSADGIKDSLIVVGILLIIGMFIFDRREV